MRKTTEKKARGRCLDPGAWSCSALWHPQNTGKALFWLYSPLFSSFLNSKGIFRPSPRPQIFSSVTLTHS